MPSNYYCASCKLGFALGWFHYHGEADGFGAETLLVCSACGTMHSVAHPASIRIPVWGGLFSKKAKSEKTERLSAQTEPCFVENAEDDVMRRLKKWEECRIAHVLQPPNKNAYLKDFLDLGPVKCHHCGRQNTIVQKRDFHDVRCPACGKPTVSVVKQWIT